MLQVMRRCIENCEGQVNSFPHVWGRVDRTSNTWGRVDRMSKIWGRVDCWQVDCVSSCFICLLSWWSKLVKENLNKNSKDTIWAIASLHNHPLSHIIVTLFLYCAVQNYIIRKACSYTVLLCVSSEMKLPEGRRGQSLSRSLLDLLAI